MAKRKRARKKESAKSCLGYKYTYGLVRTALDLQEYIPYTEYYIPYTLYQYLPYSMYGLVITALDLEVGPGCAGPEQSSPALSSGLWVPPAFWVSEVDLRQVGGFFNGSYRAPLRGSFKGDIGIDVDVDMDI